MAEYVDRHKVSDACYEIYEEVVRAGRTMTAQEVKDTILLFERAIKGVPAADVEPVRHGRWENAGGGYVACSECGEEHNWIYFRASYCDNCGAKMDQGGGTMERDLCVHCAETLRRGFDVQKIAGGVDNKITCAECGRRRYGATYKVTKKGKSE